MILTYSFSPKFQIQGKTTQELIESLKSAQDHFEKIKNFPHQVDLVVAEPEDYIWQIETGDPKIIQLARKLDFIIEDREKYEI